MSASRSEAGNGQEKLVQSQLLLGQMFLDRGDPVQAFCHFETAARSGLPSALNMLGRAYERGWGTRRNPSQAAACFAAAASGGDGWAMFNLADLFLTGQGVDRNRHQACLLYLEAARKGVAKALNMLGLLHEDGISGEPDHDTAWQFFEGAAAGGDPWGSLNLGRLCLAAGRAGPAARHISDALQSGNQEVREAAGSLLSGAADHPALRALSARCS
ncbi:sel1 repeat family protein [Acetobacter sp. AN02]|uniref:tetratricopeptide repeat protein n=1 Tax=Acetobacter sp. AN02 TaxID=2894186 RepID=UPI0024343867|nr:tetratricopeptide repeat protein [Acetobacter sp. AN02]MDG6093639.1 sel1 repeat family protein [Acetobacter sp. AN02]